MLRRHLHSETARGFSLPELAIVLAIAAILAAMALPSFADAMRRSRRSEGTSALQQIQLAEERWRTEHTSYTATIADLGIGATTTSGYYTLSIDTVSNSGYTAKATAAGSQTADTTCALIELLQAGGQSSYGSVDGGGAQTLTMPNPCWAS